MLRWRCRCSIFPLYLLLTAEIAPYCHTKITFRPGRVSMVKSSELAAFSVTFVILSIAISGQWGAETRLRILKKLFIWAWTWPATHSSQILGEKGVKIHYWKAIKQSTTWPDTNKTSDMFQNQTLSKHQETVYKCSNSLKWLILKKMIIWIVFKLQEATLKMMILKNSMK